MAWGGGGKNTGDNDTSKDGVVIQRVICVVGSRSSYHALTKANYSNWAFLMKVKLKAWALWSVMEDGSTDQQEEMMALDALYSVVLSEMVPMIAKMAMAKRAWDAIVTMRVEDDCVMKAMVQPLCWKFDLSMFDDGETVEDYVLCLSGMVACLTMLSEEVKDGEIVAKMLQSLPPRFKQITIAIKTLLDVSTMSVVDLTGWLKEAEEAFEEAPTMLQQDGKLYLTEEEWDAWRKKREVENHSGSGVRGGGTGKGCGHCRGHGHDGSSSSGSSIKPTGNECWHCSKMGHWARECHSKPWKEQAHITQDEEEALLMLATATLICPEAG
jgi:hypothetical protein